MSEKFSGRVLKIHFCNESSRYYAVRLKLDTPHPQLSYSSVSVSGTVYGIPLAVGSWLSFIGDVVNHPKYGMQIEIVKAPVIHAWDVDTAKGLLMTNGVSEVLVDLLYQECGADLISVLDDIEKLKKSSVLIESQVSYIHDRWIKIKAYYKVLLIFESLGISDYLVKKVWSYFQDDAEKVLVSNPWRLVEIPGFSFKDADNVAKSMDLSLEDPNRLIWCLLYVAKKGRGMGHTYITFGTVVGEVKKYLPNIEDRLIRDALYKAQDLELVKIDSTTRPGVMAIYETWFYNLEQECASLLQTRSKVSIHYQKADFKNLGAEEFQMFMDAEPPEDILRFALGRWEKNFNLSLSEDQRTGVLNALLKPISILTGLPGTGKSLSVKLLVRILQEMDKSFLLLAPTGIAAKRLSRYANVGAYTIHKGLGAFNAYTDSGRESAYVGILGSGVSLDNGDGSGEIWTSEGDPLEAEVIIVDESSMLDQHLLYRILKGTSQKSKLVFIGDPAQLPSVGPGNVLRDLIKADLFPTVFLTDIFRQADTSGIIEASHAICKGEVPDLTGNKDFVLVKIEEEARVFDTMYRMAEKMKDAKKQFQILSPRHLGELGVTNLNIQLRELFNPAMPGLAEFGYKGSVIREKDRVMVVKNDYDLEVFNGDVGKIHRIDSSTRKIEVVVADEIAKVKYFTYEEGQNLLRLAYASTVHKSQGLEYDYILMPIVNSFGRQLQRNLLYTAVTRAKKGVLLFGSAGAFVRAIVNDQEDKRNTLFYDRLMKGVS